MRKIFWGCFLIFPALIHALELQDVRPLTSETSYFMAPRWSPDGRLYCSTPKYADILEINLENGAIRSLTSGLGVGFKFAFGPDGSIFYKAVLDDGRELWRIDPEGKETLVAFDLEIGLPSWYNGAIRARFSEGVLSWNPDDSTEAPSADGWVFQDGSEIFQYKEGEVPHRISPPVVEACLPSQSPDGLRIIYEHLAGGLMHVNLESGASTPLGPGNNAVWSADGSFFVFDRTFDDGHHLTKGDIILMKIDEPTQNNVTENFDGIAAQPTISPDGKRIAFESGGRIWIGKLVME